MGKRQIRFLVKDIPSRLPDLVNHKGTVILKNGRVFQGTFIEDPHCILSLKDMLGKKHQLTSEAIAEIIIDQQAPF